MTEPSQSRTEYVDSFAPWKRSSVQKILEAAYNGALSLSDVEIEAIVKDALIRARRDLSS